MAWFRRDNDRTTTARPSTRPADLGFAGVSIPPVDFLIVGCMKCGTTTLRRVLSAHPDVHLPEHELHFFGNHERYLSAWREGRLDPGPFHELYARHYETGKRVLGGKTPNYIVSSLTVERIERFHPEARLVVMVRDPVARAESHWNHLLRQVRSGKVPSHVVGSSFQEHVDRDLAELADARRPDVEVRHTNVVYRGLYAPQIRRLHHFFPADRVYVGVFDDMRRDPAAFFGALWEFLGVDARPDTLAESRESPAEGDAERVRLTAAERASLAAYYAPSVRELEALLGRDLPGWRA